MRRGCASRTRARLPPTSPRPPGPATRAHGVDAEGVRSQEDTGDVGVQGEQRVLSQEPVAVATVGRAVRVAGTGVEGPGGRGAGGPHLQPDWLAMAATLQPEGKMAVARLKHSL